MCDAPGRRCRIDSPWSDCHATTSPSAHMQGARSMNQPSSFPPAPPCPDCGGERVWGTIGAPPAAEMMITVKPPGGFRTQLSPLAALTCTICGYTRLYATAPQNLRRDAP